MNVGVLQNLVFGPSLFVLHVLLRDSSMFVAATVHSTVVAPRYLLPAQIFIWIQNIYPVFSASLHLGMQEELEISQTRLIQCYCWVGSASSGGHGSLLTQVSIISFSKGIFSGFLHIGPIYFNKCLFLSVVYFHDPSDMILFPLWFISG